VAGSMRLSFAEACNPPGSTALRSRRSTCWTAFPRSRYASATD